MIYGFSLIRKLIEETIFISSGKEKLLSNRIRSILEYIMRVCHTGQRDQ